MKTLIKNKKYPLADGQVAYSMEITNIQEHIAEQIMKLIDSQCSYEVVSFVDNTKPTEYTYHINQCKTTGVHLTRCLDDGHCAFCGNK